MSEPEPPSCCCCFNGRKALLVLSLLSITSVVATSYKTPQLELLGCYAISILIEFLVFFSVSSMKSGALKYTYWILALMVFFNTLCFLFLPIYLAVQFSTGFAEDSMLGHFFEGGWPSTMSVGNRRTFGFYMGYVTEIGLFLNILFGTYRISIILQLLEIARYRENCEVKKVALA